LNFQNKYVQVFIILFLAFIWGSSFILMKKALIHYESVELAGFRIVLSGIFLIPLVIPQFKSVKKKDLAFVLISGFFGNAIPAFMWAFAQKGLNSSFAGLLNSTTPIFTMILGYFFFESKINFKTLLGVIIGLFGATFLLLSYHGVSDSPPITYSLFALAGSLCYGVSLNVIKHKLPHLPSLVITGYPFIVTSSLALMFLTANGSISKVWSTPEHMQGFLYIVTLALVATALGVYLFNIFIKATSAIYASMVTYLIPGFSVMWGFIDGESITTYYFVGLSIIISGIYLVNKGKV